MNTLPGVELAGIHKESFFGLEPVFKVAGRDGKKAENVEITRWLDGGIEIVSLLRKDGVQEEVAISLPGKKYVHDLRARKTYGPCSRFGATLLPNRASFFVLSDKALPEPQISLNSPTVQPGMTALVDISVPGALGLHAVKMSVHTGERHLDWHNRTLLVGVQPVRVEIPVAFNDPAGEYRIEFNDLFTNKSFSTGLSVHSASSAVSRQIN
jgi:hypothetical protein